MARLPSLNIPDIPQHIIQRGNNKQPCFISTRDRVVYLKKLREYSDQFLVSIHAFVLITNHVHILATPKEGDGVSLMMQALGRYYVRYFNKRHKRTGTLWEGRFKSSLVDTNNYFLSVSRYIELNPVRASIVNHPSEYFWSSYHHNATTKLSKLITEHPVYLSLGRNKTERIKQYLRFFNERLNGSVIEEIRTASNKNWVLGSELFKLQIEKLTGESMVFNSWGGFRESSK